MWGKQVWPSNIIVTTKEDKDRTRTWQIAYVKSYKEFHVKYHTSMIVFGFSGVWDLDKGVPFYNAAYPEQAEVNLNIYVVF